MRFASFATLALLLLACDDTVVVQLESGRQTFDVSADSLGLTAALRDDSSGEARIASVACGPMGMCPTSGSIAITCQGGACDPEPYTIAIPVGGVLDFEVLASEARSLVRQVEAIEIQNARYTIDENTLSVDLPEIEIFWGPEGAATVDPTMGVVALGLVPPIPARDAAAGAVVLDPAGVAALSEYLVGRSRRVRFFARTRVDLAPGGPFPEGRIRVGVDMTVRMTGSIVR